MGRFRRCITPPSNINKIENRRIEASKPYEIQPCLVVGERVYRLTLDSYETTRGGLCHEHFDYIIQRMEGVMKGWTKSLSLTTQKELKEMEIEI